jgi:hypothetical protein
MRTNGLGKVVPKGSEILFQIHYTRTGKVEHDRTSIAFIFADAPPPRVIEAYWVSNYYFRIPAGAAAHEVKGATVRQGSRSRYSSHARTGRT